MTKISYLTQQLKVRNLFPKNIQFSEWGRWTIVSAFDEVTSEFISESVAMGIDTEPETATLKALTEYCERRLSKESSDPITKITDRSDGFAAFPVFDNDEKIASARAKENSLCEATERYLWSHWWDHSNVLFEIKEVTRGTLNEDFQLLRKNFDLATIKEIQVIDSTRTFGLSIFMAEYSITGGYVTGGSCSFLNQPEKRQIPAFGELLRHLLTYENMKKAKKNQLSFYEKRLQLFASGELKEKVNSKLTQKNGNPIALPVLQINQPVLHPQSDLIKIHRCLYENQPIFMGGPVDRLCI